MERDDFYDGDGDVQNEPSHPTIFRKPRMHPPDIIGSVRLSSNDPRSIASATPLTRPANTPITPKPNQPFSTPPLVARWIPVSYDQLSSRPPNLTGAIQDQNPTVINAPVTLAAMNPGQDFLGARGMLRIGMREGRRGEEGPNRRPTVEAAVSAHERMRMAIVAISRG